MKYKALIILFLLGFAIGYVAIAPAQTGASITNCYANGELCHCTNTCDCGGKTVPLEYCTKEKL